jgi:hypothetical protein
MPADMDQMMALKEVLNKFSKSTGLKINFGKSMMVPINVPDDLMGQLATKVGCQIGTMSFTFLGLPLGTTRPTPSQILCLLSVDKKGNSHPVPTFYHRGYTTVDQLSSFLHATAFSMFLTTATMFDEAA